MSSLVVTVKQIDEIRIHPGADRLSLAIVGGWQCVVPIGKYQTGDKVVFMPPDTIIPQELSDRLGVTQYLSKQRIRCTKLRGEPSFGLVITPDEDWPINTDVSIYYGAQKYIPPVKLLGEQQERDHELFIKYVDIENLRNYPNVFTQGEMVSCTEKIHGSSGRVAIIQGERMAGSHRIRRKAPEDVDQDYHGVGTYWYPFRLESVRTLLETLSREHDQVILYGEIFGLGIQYLTYGRKGLDFRAFDLMVDGKYLDVDDFRGVCQQFGVEVVPELARIPYELTEIAKIASGKTIVGNQVHIREGVVVKPLHERTNPTLGRVVLKYLSDEYLLGQKEDFTDA